MTLTFVYDHSFDEYIGDINYDKCFIKALESLMKFNMVKNGFPIFVSYVLSELGGKYSKSLPEVLTYGWDDPKEIEFRVYTDLTTEYPNDEYQPLFVELKNLKKLR